MPTHSNDLADRSAWTYSRCRAAYISGAIGEHTFRVSLTILGLRGQDIETEINCAKGERSMNNNQYANLRERCADFKANHDMDYSVDDLIAFVKTETERVKAKSKLPGYTQYTDYRP